MQLYSSISIREQKNRKPHATNEPHASGFLGTKDFLRFRVGVSRPVHGDVSSWVLGKFSQDERIHLDILLDKSADAVESCMKIGFEKTANKYSKQYLIPMEKK